MLLDDENETAFYLFESSDRRHNMYPHAGVNKPLLSNVAALSFHIKGYLQHHSIPSFMHTHSHRQYEAVLYS